MAKDKDLDIEMEEEEQGEFIELDDEEESDVKDTEDGGAIITLENEQDRQLQTEHFANIVEDLDPAIVKSIVEDLMDKIERDKDARKKRDEELEMERLAQTNSTIKDLVTQLKEKQEQIHVVKTLLKEEIKV